MEQNEELTCGYWFFKNRKYGRCGQKATHELHGNPLCTECAEYVRSIDKRVKELTEETKKKLLCDQRRKALKEEKSA